MVLKIEDKNKKEDIARKVLCNLPEWFGIEESTKAYINSSREMPFWAYIEEEKATGFIALKETSPYTVEVYVIGVLKEYHKKGIGKKLFNEFYKYAKDNGYLYIQVKTVKEGSNDDYDKTNAFYKKLGFKEFECLPTLWDEWNPCQIYIKSIV